MAHLEPDPLGLRHRTDRVDGLVDQGRQRCPADVERHDRLIRTRFTLKDRVTIRCKYKIARSVERRRTDPREAEPDSVWIGSRTNHEIVLEKLAVAVVDDINSGINIRISDFSVSWYVRGLRLCLEIIRRAREPVHPFQLRMSVLAQQFHPNRRCLRSCKSNNRFVLGEKDRISASAAEKFHAVGSLAEVSLES